MSSKESFVSNKLMFVYDEDSGCFTGKLASQLVAEVRFNGINNKWCASCYYWPFNFTATHQDKDKAINKLLKGVSFKSARVISDIEGLRTLLKDCTDEK